jgi:chemotaxis protein methyltransferase CheR
VTRRSGPFSDLIDAPAGVGALSDEEARLIQEMIHEHCGLSYGLESAFFLERRMAPRLRELGLATYRDYYHYLRYDPAGPAELEALIERLTTHETYLFREQYQLDAFRTEILSELHQRWRSRRRLTIWSAGCSTGEEAYTLAILILEDARFRDWKVRIVGSDISRKVIARAREGTYGPSSFRTTDPAMQKRYFIDVGGQSRVRDDVRAMCSFGQLNLLSTERFHVLGQCDAIFCRNVLMYLSGAARHAIVEAFYDRLAPGGFLLLGHSESLLNVTTRFDLVHLSSDLVYQRPKGT